MKLLPGFLTFKLSPVPKGRPRVRVMGRFPQMYTPKTTAEFESEIALQTRKQWKEQMLEQFDNDVRLSVEITLACYKKTGDVDNMAKAILDGIVKAECVMHDDVAVDHLVVSRSFVKKGNESIRVVIRPVGTVTP